MASSRDHGADEPLAILERCRDGAAGYALNAGAINRLKQTLGRSEFADLPVCVISVAGAMRTGKSTLLNFMLRALRWIESGKSIDDEKWIHSEKTLSGFSWRAGVERDTTGILVWPHPFLIAKKDDRAHKTVVLLMDTQGSFDNTSEMRDCAALFAFSTMVASVQIFNVRANLDENVLQYLDAFTAFGVNTAPDFRLYQHLTFLIRDWCLDDKLGFGGGSSLLKTRLNEIPTMSSGQKEMRKRIQSAFQTIDCFLMSSPGQKPCRGDWSNLGNVEQDFLDDLRELIASPLFREKRINGNTVTCAQLLDYMEKLTVVFDRNHTPDIKSMFDAMKEGTNALSLKSAIQYYSCRFRLEAEVSGLEAADRKLREAALNQLLGNLIDANAVRQTMIAQLNDALNDHKDRITRDWELENGRLVEERYQKFLTDIRASTATRDVSTCYESCKMTALKGLNEQLKGGANVARTATEGLTRKMDDERRRIQDAQEQKRRADAAEQARLKAERDKQQAERERQQAERERQQAEQRAREERERREKAERDAAAERERRAKAERDAAAERERAAREASEARQRIASMRMQSSSSSSHDGWGFGGFHFASSPAPSFASSSGSTVSIGKTGALRYNQQSDGSFQDRNGRWRGDNGRFIKHS